MVLLLCVCFTTYFGYHTFHGRHGLAARYGLTQRSSELERDIIAHEAVRSRLERELALLSPTAPDADYVDDLARRMLGFAHPRDRLILVRPSASTTRR